MSAMSVTHIITDLEIGGAQMMLARLLEGLEPEDVESHVISLKPVGALADRIGRRAIDIGSLGLGSPRTWPEGIRRLRRYLSDQRPDVVHTWMYHANLLGGLAARSASIEAIVWGIHHTDLPRDETKRLTRLFDRASARASSRIPRSIVCCARSSYIHHIQRGYDETRMIVIPNGFEIPAEETDARRRLFDELDCPAQTRIVGRVGRWAVQKDLPNFMSAAEMVGMHHPFARFVLVGPGMDNSNEELRALIAGTKIADRLHLLGPRSDIGRITAAFDVAVSSSSFGEAHPCVIGEALAAAIPVVATDVGDSRDMIGDAGRVVPPRDPARLAKAIEELLRLEPEERKRIGAAGRARIETRFSIERMTTSYRSLYESLGRNPHRS